MVYTVYNSWEAAKAPEINAVWAVLLYSDRLRIMSRAGLSAGMYSHFKLMNDAEKRAVFEYYNKVAPLEGWEHFITIYDTLQGLRRKKKKTADDMKHLKHIEKGWRGLENSFVDMMAEFIKIHGYYEIAPLVVAEEDEETEVQIIVPVSTWEVRRPGSLQRHHLEMLIESFTDPDNVLVVDDGIAQVSTMYDLGDKNWMKTMLKEWDRDSKREHEKTGICIGKIIEIPLCVTLTSNEITLARNELKQVFRPYHDKLKETAAKLSDEKDLSSSIKMLNDFMEEMRPMFSTLQQGVDHNVYVMKSLNEKNDLKRVAVHLAFATNKGILTLFHKMGMLTDESFHQACDLVDKQAGLNSLKPFVYVKQL